MYSTDYFCVKSGKDVDKWQEMKLTTAAADVVKAPCIKESPVNIECRVTEIKRLGSHDLFLAEVAAVHVDDAYMDKNGAFHLSQAAPIVYCHGEYFALGEKLGKFGYSVQKRT